MEKCQTGCHHCGAEFFSIEASFEGPAETNAFLGMDQYYYCEDCIDAADAEYEFEQIDEDIEELEALMESTHLGNVSKEWDVIDFKGGSTNENRYAHTQL